MKNMLRHFSSWLLMAGISISFFAFLNGEDLYQKMKNALAEVNEYRYKKSYLIQIFEIDNQQELFERLCEMEGNVQLSDLHLQTDVSGAYHLCDYLIKQDEPLPFPVEQIAETGDVIIGEGILPECRQDETGTLFLELEGKRYYVYGIAKGKNSNLLYGKLVICPGGTQVQDSLQKYGYDAFKVLYGSSQVELEEAVQEFEADMQDTCTVFYERDAEQYYEVGAEASAERFNMMIAVFAMINCIIISEFWIIRRRQEMVIRKIWGFSNGKLYFLIYRELVVLSLISVLFVLTIQTIVYICSNHNYGMIPGRQFLLGCVFVLISSALIGIKPILQAARYRASDGLEG